MKQFDHLHSILIREVFRLYPEIQIEISIWMKYARALLSFAVYTSELSLALVWFIQLNCPSKKTPKLRITGE